MIPPQLHLFRPPSARLFPLLVFRSLASKAKVDPELDATILSFPDRALTSNFKKDADGEDTSDKGENLRQRIIYVASGLSMHFGKGASFRVDRILDEAREGFATYEVAQSTLTELLNLKRIGPKFEAVLTTLIGRWADCVTISDDFALIGADPSDWATLQRENSGVAHINRAKQALVESNDWEFSMNKKQRRSKEAGWKKEIEANTSALGFAMRLQREQLPEDVNLWVDGFIARHKFKGKLERGIYKRLLQVAGCFILLKISNPISPGSRDLAVKALESIKVNDLMFFHGITIGKKVLLCHSGSLEAQKFSELTKSQKQSIESVAVAANLKHRLLLLNDITDESIGVDADSDVD